MDQIASVLLDFPAAGGYVDDEQYHRAAKLHSQHVGKLASTQQFRDAAAQLLNVRELWLRVCSSQPLTDPAAHSSGRQFHLAPGPAGVCWGDEQSHPRRALGPHLRLPHHIRCPPDTLRGQELFGRPRFARPREPLSGEWQLSRLVALEDLANDPRPRLPWNSSQQHS